MTYLLCWYSFSLTQVLQVLHIDRNNYYGGASASLNLNQARLHCHAYFPHFACVRVSSNALLQGGAGKRGAHSLTGIAFLQLYERFRPGQTPPKSLGPSRDYNVDMVPKFILSGGELVRSIRPSHRGRPGNTRNCSACLQAC